VETRHDDQVQTTFDAVASASSEIGNGELEALIAVGGRRTQLAPGLLAVAGRRGIAGRIVNGG
jgi:hypothetical protein